MITSFVAIELVLELSDAPSYPVHVLKSSVSCFCSKHI